MEKSGCEAYFRLSSGKIVFPEQQGRQAGHMQRRGQGQDEVVITDREVEKDKTKVDQQGEVKDKLLIVHCNSASGIVGRRKPCHTSKETGVLLS